MLYFTNEILYMQGRPWARATPQAFGLGQPLTPGQPMGLKKKKKIVINQYTQQTNK